jgi:hypothetical protein
MPNYAIERTTLPLTAGNKSLVEVFAVEAANFAEAITKLKANLGTTPDQIVKPLGYLDDKVAALFDFTGGSPTFLYALF